MTTPPDTIVPAPRPPAAPRRAWTFRRVLGRTLRWTGSALVLGSLVVLLYSVYLMWFTGLETDRAQRGLAETWHQIPIDQPVQAVGPAAPPPQRSDVAVGDAYAAMWFERSGTRIIHTETLFVVEGVTLEALKRGPGRYDSSGAPGGRGNFAVAGHRTTYGAPFGQLDQLRTGDTIHVVDHVGIEWVYGFREQRVVGPSEVWVLDDDPLGDGSATITLTTCHPRHSAAQRLIVWGELLGTARR